MKRRLFLALAATSIGIMLPGCAKEQQLPPIPAELVDAAQIPGISQARQWGDEPGADFRVAANGRGSTLANHGPTTGGPLRVLALSGGGANAAFAAGLLTGWTAAGTRPTFHVVTGVSAGALAAPFALLGSARDDTLRSLFTGLVGTNLVQERPRIVALFSDSLARAEPLRKVIEQHVDATLMHEIAAEHRRGRRLLVGTTHVYAGRLVIWNIGAIADSGHGGALELIRRVLLASAAVPIMLPPVQIEVEAGGRRYLEMHVDGGMTRQVFVAPPGLGWNSLPQGNDRHRGLEFYVIRSGRVRSEYMFMPDRLVPLGEHALHLLAQSQGVGDLYIIYVQAQRVGAIYKAAWIGDEFQAPWTQWYDPPYMRALFEYGYRKAVSGTAWHHEPPGVASANGHP